MVLELILKFLLPILAVSGVGLFVYNKGRKKGEEKADKLKNKLTEEMLKAMKEKEKADNNIKKRNNKLRKEYKKKVKKINERGDLDEKAIDNIFDDMFNNN